MELTTENGSMILPEDFSFEIEVNNPFFSDEGTTSVPATLPAVLENLLNTGHPERPGRATRHIRTIPATLRHGIFSRKCNMIVDGAGKEDGISCSLAFNESEMYSSIKEKKLKDVFSDKVYIPQGVTNPIKDILYDEVYCVTEASKGLDFTIFPVAVDKTDDGTYMMLNQPSGSTFLSGERDISYPDETIHVPAGYGVTPFLWLHRFITLTFELLGYKIRRNDFTEEPFDKLVLLNSCSDTLCGSLAIRYKDLVPSITVEEMIVWLKDKFGATVSMDRGYIDVVLMQKCLGASPDLDLTQYVRDEIKLTYPESSRVVLSCDTSLDGAEPSVETLSKFKKKYPSIKKILLNATPANGIYLKPQLGQFVQVSGYSAADPDSYDETFRGSNCFTYDRDNSEGTDSHETDDKYTPMALVGSRLMPYVGDRLHFNTSIKGEEEDADQPVMVCWMFQSGGKAFGSTQPYDIDGNKMQYKVIISGFELTEDYPELTPEGLYPYCWQRYNEILLNSAPEIKAQIDMPLPVILSLDIMTPKLMKGQKVMIKSFSYTIGNDGTKCGECTLQLIPAYVDAVIDEPIDLVESIVRWVLYDGRQKAINEKAAANEYLVVSYQLTVTDDYTDYSSSDAPDYRPETVGVIEKYRIREGSLRITDAKPSTRYYNITWEEYFISK